jgi:hypothetical protein
VDAFLKLCAAGLAGALISTATIAAASQPALVDANTSTIHIAAMVIALNPQPLPPYTGGDDDYDFLRG